MIVYKIIHKIYIQLEQRIFCLSLNFLNTMLARKVLEQLTSRKIAPQY